MAAACNLTFCVVGRDARQLAAARALQNSGYTVLGAGRQLKPNRPSR